MYKDKDDFSDLTDPSTADGGMIQYTAIDIEVVDAETQKSAKKLLRGMVNWVGLDEEQRAQLNERIKIESFTLGGLLFNLKLAKHALATIHRLLNSGFNASLETYNSVNMMHRLHADITGKVMSYMHQLPQAVSSIAMMYMSQPLTPSEMRGGEEQQLLDAEYGGDITEPIRGTKALLLKYKELRTIANTNYEEALAEEDDTEAPIIDLTQIRQ